MNVTGVIETALHVDNVKTAGDFYRKLFSFETMVADDRFCALSVAGRQVLLLFKKGGTLEPIVFAGGTIPPHGGNGRLHLAFSIPASDLEGWRTRLRDEGIVIESEVTWERGGHSLYFRDPDQHLVELVTPGCWPIY
jgi:catechol 2,3-dioxygenase-like lactoylglutathione lyase family enzyme